MCLEALYPCTPSQSYGKLDGDGSDVVRAMHWLVCIPHVTNAPPDWSTEIQCGSSVGRTTSSAGMSALLVQHRTWDCIHDTLADRFMMTMQFGG